MVLTLDIPAVPLFKNSGEKNFIPNVPIYELLSKYDGTNPQEKKEERKFFKLRKLPRILIIHMKRLTNNGLFYEKNPTIVTFPLEDLDLKPY